MPKPAKRLEIYSDSKINVLVFVNSDAGMTQEVAEFITNLTGSKAKPTKAKKAPAKATKKAPATKAKAKTTTKKAPAKAKANGPRQRISHRGAKVLNEFKKVQVLKKQRRTPDELKALARVHELLLKENYGAVTNMIKAEKDKRAKAKTAKKTVTKKPAKPAKKKVNKAPAKKKAAKKIVKKKIIKKKPSAKKTPQRVVNKKKAPASGRSKNQKLAKTFGFDPLKEEIDF